MISTNIIPLIKELIQAILGSAFDSLKENIQEIIDDLQIQAREIIKEATKSLMVISIALVGIIFLLVGIAMLLNSRVPALAGGGGYVVVGGVLFLLGLFAAAIRK